MQNSVQTVTGAPDQTRHYYTMPPKTDTESKRKRTVIQERGKEMEKEKTLESIIYMTK